MKPSEFSGYNNLILYDTDKEYYKICCATKVGNSKAKCLAIFASAYYYSYLQRFDINQEMIDLKKGEIGIHPEKHECYMTGFYAEFLFCCADKKIISCKRLDNKYNYIKEFDIDYECNIKYYQNH